MILVALAYALAFVLLGFAAAAPRPMLLPEADGIVVLTGGGTRLDAAVALFEKGVGKRLLISGVGLATTKRDAERRGAWRAAFRLLRRYRLCRRRHPWQCRRKRRTGRMAIISTAS